MTRIVDPVLSDLRQKILRMASLAEAILEKSLESVWKKDPALAREVKIDDLDVDRMELMVDEAVLRTLATQAPVADDLRAVVAIKTMSTDLERVGDLARNIAKSSLRLADQDIQPPPRLRVLADQAQRLLRHALDSFTEGDTERARAVLVDEDLADEEEAAVVREAIAQISSHPESTSPEVDFILIAKNLERVADHATNIAEDVIMVAEARNIKHADKLAGDG